MERLRLLGAAAGALFAVLIVAAFAIAPGPSSAADVQVINYYTEHGNAAIWQAVLAGFGLVCFVWFAAVLSGWSPAGPAVLVATFRGGPHGSCPAPAAESIVYVSPVATNTTEEGRAVNRRVAITFVHR